MEIHEDFSPQLRPSIEVHPFDTIEDGEFLLLRNPEHARYLKLKKKADSLIKKMDGKTSVAQLQNMYKDIDVFHLVKTLANAGFLTELESEEYAVPLHTVKIPFFDANKEFLQKIYRFLRFTGSKPFLIGYTIFVLSGMILFLTHFRTIVEYAYMNFHLGVPLTYLLIFFVIFYIVEFAHELAHAGASYNCGAEPGRVGLVFHFLVAFFYADTPNTRILDKKGNILVFVSGPLLSILAAELSTYMFLFTENMPMVWAASSFFWHTSTLITLSPFMQTDGYYIVQCLARFPNLLDHSILYAKTRVKQWVRLIDKKVYTQVMSKWNEKQKKFLFVYMWLWPVQTLILTYFFFFSVNKANVLHVFRVFPEILSAGNPYGYKGYFLVAFYSWGIIAGLLPVVLTVRNYLRRGRSHV